ncbi:hypothetical protein FG379_003078, partial [Cryptosporidium bovis]|uniref:uncharacterized protein n=1 Tax=Cryptosporidium bovis TaxID=310047 RepID=UPI003519D8DA
TKKGIPLCFFSSIIGIWRMMGRTLEFCTIIYVVFNSLISSSALQTEYNEFVLGRVGSQKLEIKSKTNQGTSNNLEEYGSLGSYMFKNENDKTVLTSILFPSFAVLYDPIRRQFCSGKYKSDSYSYSPGNEIPFSVNYWTDKYNSRYWVLESEGGVICMLPYTLSNNFTKVIADVDSEFEYDPSAIYEPNSTDKIIRQSSVTSYVSSCTIGIFQGCLSNEFMLTVDSTLYSTGIEISLMGVFGIKTKNGIFNEYAFYDKSSSKKIMHLMINPDMIGLYFENSSGEKQKWGSLGEDIEIGNMKFNYNLRLIVKEVRSRSSNLMDL